MLGRRVRSFMSAHDFERNLQRCEVFVLKGPRRPATFATVRPLALISH
jgi:hypothetical protein